MTARARALLAAAILVLTVASAASDEHAWARVRDLKPGERIWVSTGETPLTELYYAKLDDRTLRVAVVSATDASKASKQRVTELCAGSPDRRLVVAGEELDFPALCRVLPRDEVVEIKTRRRGPPWRAAAIGAGVGGGAMLVPCGVAPQANGSSAGCALAGAALGAMIAWTVHVLRRGPIAAIYQRAPASVGSREEEPVWPRVGDYIVSPPLTP